MNTNEIANILGISSSTVKRWVKQLGIEPSRNAKGHFIYTQSEFDQLHAFHQDQLKQENPLSFLPAEKDEQVLKLEDKIQDIELQLYKKADGVTSVQLLQHRREIEDLLVAVEKLEGRIEQLETQMNKSKKPPAKVEPISLDVPQTLKRKRKRKIMSMMFGI